MKNNQKNLQELEKELAAEIQDKIDNRQIRIQEKLLKLNLMEIGILFKN